MIDLKYIVRHLRYNGFSREQIRGILIQALIDQRADRDDGKTWEESLAELEEFLRGQP